MRLTDEELRDLQRRHSSAAQQGRHECLSEETLFLAASNRLDTEARERVADHLAGCSDCAEDYRVALSAGEWAAAATAELGPAEAPHLAAAPAGAQRDLGIVRLRWAYAAVAALLLLSVLLGGRVLQLSSEIEGVRGGSAESPPEAAPLDEWRLRAEEAQAKLAQSEARVSELARDLAAVRQPRLNTPIYDLTPPGAMRGETGDVRTITIPPGADFFALILHPTGTSAYAGYALRIEDAAGAEVWSGQGLRKTPENNFIVLLSRATFPPGTYTIRLLGSAGERTVQIEAFRIAIRSSD